jgi:diguanylate cyclase (GGDEF)-like protein
MVASSLAGFFAVSSLDLYDKAFYVQQALILVALPLLVQFAYSFPEIAPADRRETKLSLTISIFICVISLASILLKLFQVAFFVNNPLIISYAVEVLQIAILVWIITRFIKLNLHYAQNPKEPNRLKRFFTSTGRVSKATFGFAISILCLLLVWIASMLLDIFGLVSLGIFVFSFGTSWSLAFFVFTLINQTTLKSSLLLKLISFIMLSVFSGVSAAAWLTAPVSQANYLASYSIPDRQTIHFEQSNAIYTITQDEFFLESDLGSKVTFEKQANNTLLNLSVTFPFAGKNWTKLLINRNGFVQFTEGKVEEIQPNLSQYSNPIIAALYLEDISLTENSAVFAHLTDDKSVFTWFLVTPIDNPDETISAQLTLFPDGSFDISYTGIHSYFNYSPYIPKELTQLSGYFLGSNDQNPTRIQFNASLPFTSKAWSGVYQDYYIDFRSFLHQSMSILLFALLLVTIVTGVVFPIFFQNSLWAPIKLIRSGIQQISQDNYQVFLEPRYTDELGQTVMEFNHMASHLETKVTDKNTRLKELEAHLSQRTSELKTSVEKLSKEVDLRKRLSEALDKSTAQLKKTSTTDELTGIINRARLVEICEEEIKRAKRYHTPLSFVIMDPDYLRMINETYGNTTGDEVLKSLSQLVQEKLRETDIFGRIGGEEFAILMPQTAGKDALAAGNRIRNIIGSQFLSTAKGPIRISASFGVAEMTQEGLLSVDILFHRANQALDHAKNNGRNCVILWNQNLENKEKE